jgi:SAM-dependent methyltransferase
MPTSDPRVISTIVHRAIGLMPLSVLDLGIGYGKYGVLLREYIGYNVDRTPRIEGVEGWDNYSKGNWSAYDEVYRHDFSDRGWWPRYVGFDLVLMIDSLEHLPPADAEDLLSHLIKNNKTVIISVPNGVCPQGVYKGNVLETHRSTWYRSNIVPFGGQILFESDFGLVAEFKGAL